MAAPLRDGYDAMFDQHFDVFLADNEAGKRVSYQLRYQVYCLETGWEDPKGYPHHLERDGFDERSIHLLVRERTSGRWVAGMRLITGMLPTMPMWQHCTVESNEVPADVALGPVAELSRLFVVGDYRRRRQERGTPYESPWGHERRSRPRKVVTLDDRRKEPEIMLGLIRAARDCSLALGIRYWFFMITPSLARVLQRIGLGLKACGPETEFRGIRRPYHGDLATFFDDVARRSTTARDVFAQSVPIRRCSELKAAALVTTPPGQLDSNR